MIRDRPQRLTPIAAPGTLLKHLSAVHASWQLARVTDGADEAYLALIRQLPCLHCGLEPCGEAAHLRMASGAHGKASGMSKRPADRWALPVCGEHHRLAQRAQHTIGERQFWHEIDVDPLLTAERLYARRNSFAAMHAVVLLTIAERTR